MSSIIQYFHSDVRKLLLFLQAWMQDTCPSPCPSIRPLLEELSSPSEVQIKQTMDPSKGVLGVTKQQLNGFNESISSKAGNLSKEAYLTAYQLNDNLPNSLNSTIFDELTCMDTMPTESHADVLASLQLFDYVSDTLSSTDILQTLQVSLNLLKKQVFFVLAGRQ